MKEEEIIHNFSYHAPSDTDVTKHEVLRKECQELALLIHNVCPESREKSIAITKLEEVSMWGNAAIARNK
jgi:hypothetical protein